MFLLHWETSYVNKWKELRLATLVEYNTTGIHLRHRNVGHIVHHLMYQEVSDLVTIIVQLIVLHHCIWELRHSSCFGNVESPQSDVRDRFLALSAYGNRLENTVSNLVRSNDAHSSINLSLGQVHRSHREIGRHKLVVVVMTISSTTESKFHVRFQHLILANDVCPLQALLLLKFGLRICSLGDFFRHNSLTTILSEGKVTCRAVEFGNNSSKSCHNNLNLSDKK